MSFISTMVSFLQHILSYTVFNASSPWYMQLGCSVRTPQNALWGVGPLYHRIQRSIFLLLISNIYTSVFGILFILHKLPIISDTRALVGTNVPPHQSHHAPSPNRQRLILHWKSTYLCAPPPQKEAPRGVGPAQKETHMTGTFTPDI